MYKNIEQPGQNCSLQCVRKCVLMCPNVSDFLYVPQSSIDNDIVSMRLGVQPPKKTKKKIMNQERIFNATQQYDSMNLFAFLDFLMEL